MYSLSGSLRTLVHQNQSIMLSCCRVVGLEATAFPLRSGRGALQCPSPLQHKVFDPFQLAVFDAGPNPLCPHFVPEIHFVTSNRSSTTFQQNRSGTLCANILEESPCKCQFSCHVRVGNSHLWEGFDQSCGFEGCSAVMTNNTMVVQCNHCCPI